MTNSEINKAFLNWVSNDIKSIILSNIATHYGVSNSEAKKEILDKDSENIMDYITGKSRSLISLQYQFFIYNLNKSIK